MLSRERHGLVYIQTNNCLITRKFKHVYNYCSIHGHECTILIRFMCSVFMIDQCSTMMLRMNAVLYWAGLSIVILYWLFAQSVVMHCTNYIMLIIMTCIYNEGHICQLSLKWIFINSWHACRFSNIDCKVNKWWQHTESHYCSPVNV